MTSPASSPHGPRHIGEGALEDMLGDAFFHQLHGDDVSAINLYRDVLEGDRDNAKALLGMGKILFEAGEKDDAEKYWMRAIKCTPLDAATAHYLSLAIRNFARPAEARWCARKAVELAPGDATFNYDLGALLSNSGLVYEAKEYLERAVQLRPGNVDIVRGMGQFCCTDFVFAARGIELVAPLVEQHPDDMDLLNILAKLYWVNQRFSDAAEALRKFHLGNVTRRKDCGCCSVATLLLPNQSYTSIWNKRRWGTPSGFPPIR